MKLKFPGMRKDRSFQGQPIRFGTVEDLHHEPEMVPYYQDMAAKMAAMEGTDKELEMLHIYVSLKKTGIMHNPIDVVYTNGEMIIVRGNQRFCCLVAMGYTGPIPFRVWKRWEDVPQYVIEDDPSKDIRQLVVYPRKHVKAKRILRLPGGLKGVLPNGSLMLTESEYELVKHQLPEEDYIVVRP